jgi:beta-glucosidase
VPVDQRVADLLGRMTLEEKIGQMTQAERGVVAGDPSLIRTQRLGSVLSGGGSTPADNNPAAWVAMVNTFQQQTLATRLGIPLIYGVDAVHGHGNVYGATIFPHNIGLGSTRDPRLVDQVGEVTAAEVRAAGILWSFGPCVCVARDERWGRTYESFGEDPALVVSIETLAPYEAAVGQHDVGSVMPSFSSVDWIEDGIGNPLKMHAHHELITDVLKGQLGFDGFLISDWEGIHQFPDPSNPTNGGLTPYKVRTGVNAGTDMFMEPFSSGPFESLLLAEVTAGRVSKARIDDAVARILRTKSELGLFEHPFASLSDVHEVGSPSHRAVARKAAAESQALLKNADGALPLDKHANVYVAGRNADNIGNQAGGWTIAWQGISGDIIPGTTILEGIREVAPDATVTYSADASAPMEEKSLSLQPGDKAVIDKVCDAIDTCVVLVVSGRPQVLTDQLEKIDALVASWLPGSEGDGVADVLFGERPFTERLSTTWPRSEVQVPINVGTPTTSRSSRSAGACARTRCPAGSSRPSRTSARVTGIRPYARRCATSTGRSQARTGPAARPGRWRYCAHSARRWRRSTAGRPGPRPRERPSCRSRATSHNRR